MIYLDSCLVIYAIEPNGEATEQTVSAIGSVPDIFAISPLVCLECLVHPLRTGNEELVRRFEQFFAAVTQIPLDAAMYREAAALRARFGLRTPDALHVAAAQLSGCSAIWTNDQRLAKAIGAFARSVVDRTA